MIYLSFPDIHFLPASLPSSQITDFKKIKLAKEMIGGRNVITFANIPFTEVILFRVYF